MHDEVSEQEHNTLKRFEGFAVRGLVDVGSDMLVVLREMLLCIFT